MQEISSDEAPIHSVESIRDQTFEEEADKLAKQAQEAYQDGEHQTSRELFEDALAVNAKRTDTYRFRQAFDLFVTFREHYRLDAETSLSEIVFNRYERNSFEHISFARTILRYGLVKGDAPLISVAEEMLDDNYIIISTILDAVKSGDDYASIGDLRRAQLILETMHVDRVNEQLWLRTRKRIIEAINAKQRSC